MPREGKARVLDKNEQERLLTILRAGKYPERNLALFYISFGCGLRVKEIASLNIGDIIDLEGNLIAEVNLKKNMTKAGGKPRTFYLVSKDVVKAIEAYVKIRMQMEAPPPNQDAPFFVTQKRQRFSPNTLQKAFHIFYEKAGLHGASSHTGRRTFATVLAAKGVGIEKLQVLMGHEDIKTTARYIDNNPESLKKIVKDLVF